MPPCCAHVPTLHPTLQAVLRLPYGAPIDLWSAGVVLAEAALKQPLLRCRTPVEAVQAVSPLHLSFPLWFLRWMDGPWRFGLAFFGHAGACLTHTQG